jgi:hypothetical protein
MQNTENASQHPPFKRYGVLIQNKENTDNEEADRTIQHSMFYTH